MFYGRMLGLILLSATTIWGQTSPGSGATPQAHYPRLLRADVPLYPPLARTAHISGTVEIQVVVEKGTVTDAQVKSVVLASWNGPELTDDGKKKVGRYLSEPSLANLKTWEFQMEDRAEFLVTYAYRIEGEETNQPENAKVELELPILVRITVRPFKPTCHDCSTSLVNAVTSQVDSGAGITGLATNQALGEVSRSAPLTDRQEPEIRRVVGSWTVPQSPRKI